ncbi:MAG: methyl-accepting chemotaxis protein [Spirochaetales bacterium]|nr:methyl-accepting chemotaxis protein [Spirochaetales bacterium]
MKIGTKITGGYGVLLMLMLIIGVVVFSGISRISAATEVNRKIISEQLLLFDLRLFVFKKDKIIADTIINRNLADQESAYDAVRLSMKSIDNEADLLMDNTEEVAWMKEFDEANANLDALYVNSIVPVVENGNRDNLSDLYEQEKLLITIMLDRTTQFVDALHVDAENSRAELHNTSGQVLMITIILIIIAVLVGIVVSILITRSVVRPLRAAVTAARKIEVGDLSLNLSELNRQDETGDLLRSFAQMSESLQKQMSEIAEAANVLASTSNEILALSSQLVASSTESSTALMQTTTTVEEIKQTSQSANEKAKKISADFQKTAEISQEGERAAEETVEGMNLIKGQMENIAESIVRLSEQSQTIGEIIGSVDDIAEQSNLLAVNAAIEAAKAGEQGRGFAVVAGEIKTLSEQSKRATAQVRSVLNDIQKATSNAVMVTEEGSKTVDAGAGQTSKAGEAIRLLADSVLKSSQAAIQIAASGQEQQAGMQQIAQAMQDIRTASEQNLSGTKQLEEASHNLSDLGTKLKEMTGRYKISLVAKA